VTRPHREQVFDAHGSELVIHDRRQVLRKEGDDLVLKPEASLIESHADRTRQEALGDRVHDAGTIRPIGPPPAFRNHPAGAVKHQSMYFEALGRGVIQKRLHGRRIDIDFTRLRPFQSVCILHIARLGFCHSVPLAAILYFYQV